MKVLLFMEVMLVVYGSECLYSGGIRRRTFEDFLKWVH
jgi:hypothetical protein